MIPWEQYEPEYAKQFSHDTGQPAIKFRMAAATLIIKQMTNHSDEDVLQDILENPYMQYLIGLHEFTTEAPFTSQSITNFRKYVSKELIDKINNDIFRNTHGGGDGKSEQDSHSATDGTPETSVTHAEAQPENKGSLILDATCAPADIAYPTDVNLLNEARVKLETIIDILHDQSGNWLKPRTYRMVARKNYLSFVKVKQPGKKKIRKAIKAQLGYVRRNMGHVDKLLEQVGAEALSEKQLGRLMTIRLLYEQQLEMYTNNTHSVPNRIVSISQPHVRPIVRGKARAKTEFGAKVSISMVDGYAFIDRVSFDAYNEEELFQPAIEEYKERYGNYPEVVMVDRIYRNRKNLAYCKKWGIRVTGPRLGRPPKVLDKDLIRQTRLDNGARNAVEGKFGEGKIKYGLDRIKAKLKETSETVISMIFLCMNISRRLRFLALIFGKVQIFVRFACLTVDNFFQNRKFLFFGG
jgi:hypothetical protein